jgi:hypothetical protein
MSSHKIISLCLFPAVFLSLASLSFCQPPSKPSSPQQTVSVSGRLNIEKHGQEEWLILHDLNAETFLIKGSLIEKIKDSFSKLGVDNIFTLKGIRDGSSSLVCDRYSSYEEDKNGVNRLKVQTRCIRYYIFDVTEIVSAEKSNKEIPAPKRETGEETKLTNEALTKQPLTQPITGVINGKIASINLRSPVKSVVVTNGDAKSPLKEITLLITPTTRFAKKTGDKEPLLLTVESLKVGADVSAVYSRTENKTEALFITLTKE